jgi:hypothetical protein
VGNATVSLDVDRGIMLDSKTASAVLVATSERPHDVTVVVTAMEGSRPACRLRACGSRDRDRLDSPIPRPRDASCTTTSSIRAFRIRGAKRRTALRSTRLRAA